LLFLLEQLQFQDKGLMLQHLHPVAALAYLGVLAGLALVFTHPLYLLGLLGLIILAIRAADGLAGWVICLKFSLGMSGLILLINLLVVRAGETVIWRGQQLPILGELRISLEAICFGAAMSLRLLVVLSVFYLLNLIIHPDRLLRLLSRLAGRSALVLSLVTRLFPYVFRQMNNLQEVLRVRGVDFQAGTWREQQQKYWLLFNNLLISSLENSWELAEAMQARAFGSGPRSRYWREVFRPRDVLCLMVSMLALLTAIYGQIKGSSTFQFYPQLDYLLKDKLTLLLLGIIIGALSLPVILSWGWRYWPYLNARI
jgi:energy-coupling factor transport system permease protein